MEAEQRERIEELAECHEYQNGCDVEGAEKVAEGRGRVVYDVGLDGCVVKVARWDVGVDDNRDEAEFFDELSYKEEKYFAGVGEIGEDGRWITMERIEGEPTEEEISDWTDGLILAGNYRRITCGDNLPKNFGVKDGDAVRIDWGNDCKKR